MVPGSFRLAELLGGLSLACDLANGEAPGKVMRTVVLGAQLARLHGLSERDQHDAFYVNLLRFLGCTAFSHEEAHVYGAGDDIGTRRTMALADAADPLQVVGRVVRGIGAGGPLLARVRAVARLLGDSEAVAKHARTQCDASVRMAEIVRLGPRVRGALRQICERWDGNGAPARVRGESLDMAARVHHLADVVELVHAHEGRQAARDVVQKRAGGHFDPALSQTFLKHADELLGNIEQPELWDTFLRSEPAPHVLANASHTDDVALAFAHFADIKSVYTLGHSPAVAALAKRAAAVLGMSEVEQVDLYRAALLHDIGRVAVPNSVWDKPARLNVAEWERVRLHAYYTERVLAQCPALRTLGVIASAAHERCDGAGYHRSLQRAAIPLAARVLASADAFQAMQERRPHRAALSREAACAEMLSGVERGQFDAQAVQAVLQAADIVVPRTTATHPAGLSEREVEVLRWLAQGLSNKEIAGRLDISAKTVQHHVAHVYDKIGVASRAAAALFAAEAGLLRP